MINDDGEVGIIQLGSIQFGERRRVEYGKIDDLVQSIQDRGLICPLAVKRLGPESYLLLAGGRRYRALTMLQVDKVPVRIYSRDLSELEIRSIELAENMDRKELTWVEHTRMCEEIHKLQVAIHGESIGSGPGNTGWKQSDTANLTGVSKAQVQHDLKLASAMTLFPELALCKTKDEAQKRLKKLAVNVKTSIVAASLAKADQKPGAEAALQANLVNSYIIMDCFEGISGLPDSSIDFVEIDPPYGIELNKKKASADGHAMQTDEYNEWDAEDYIQKMSDLIFQSYRVLKPEGWLVCWFGPDPWFGPIYKAIVDNAFQCRSIPAIWLKGDITTEGSGQTLNPGVYLANAYEMFFYARKGQAKLYKQGRSNVFGYKPVSAQSKIHPTERPIELMMEVCNVFCPVEGTVLTPFAGSGNTLLAAHNTYRKAFGYDLSKEYKDRYTLRVFEGTSRKYRSYKEVSVL